MGKELALEGVSKSFGGPKGGVEETIKDVTFSVDSGESLAVIGPSGAGKTTLLRLASGAIKPTRGSVVVDGTDFASVNGRRFRKAQQRASLVYQGDSLLTRRSALTNVLTGRIGHLSWYRGLVEPLLPLDPEPALELLDSVGLGDKSDSRVDELSAGERQRVSIARAVIQDAPVILADEPTANLDPSTSETVVRLLKKAAADTALLTVLHDVEVALEHYPRIIGVRDGGIFFDKPSADISGSDLDDLFIGPAEGPSGDDAQSEDDDDIGRGCWDV